ncbi:MAG TPA: Ig-like domain-containing protein [Mycobacteriales bacterium]|nr:Ig-like domain-containing protein [Mycobacteriales bacterium]
MRRSLRLAAVVGAVGATTIVLPLALAAPASAAGLLPTTTTVSSSTTSATVGDSVTFTATVSVLGLPGLGVTPAGNVDFSVNNGSGPQDLGTGSLGFCLLKTCTASLTTTALPAGTDVMTATYGGDLLAGTSHGTVTVTMFDGVSDTTTCAPGQFCSIDEITTNDGTTSLDVTAGPSGQTDVVTGSLTEGEQLSCPVRTDIGTGALADFSNTASDIGKTIDYTGHGATGQQMYNNFLAHPRYAGCFASKHPFMGYVNGVYTNAVLVHETFGDFYEAQIANCRYVGDGDHDRDDLAVLPCFINIVPESESSFTAHELVGGMDDTYRVFTAPGDPKMSG